MHRDLPVRLMIVTVVLALLANGASLAGAAGVNGIALCTAASDQSHPVATPDGTGGVIVAWHDERPTASAGGVCYAQRLNATGSPQWSANGVVLSTSGDPGLPVIAPDGLGGAFLAYAGSNSGPRAQWVNAAGVPQWGLDGVALSVTASPKRELAIAADLGGSGGAIVAWREDNGAGGTSDVYAQKVSSAGAIQWSSSGATVSATTMNSETLPALISDGAGGAIVVFLFSGGGSARMQRLNASGVTQWSSTSLTGTTNNNPPAIVSDGAGGAVVAWAGGGIFAQRVSSAGVRQWSPTNAGVTLSTTGNLPTMIPDGAGGATVTWQDLRSGTNFNIYAQRVNGTGAPQWIANGAAVCTATNDQRSPAIVSDGATGAIVAWYDSRSGASVDDIYAQRISSAGVPQWNIDGMSVCTAADNQQFPAVASDAAGGAFIAWQDHRSGTNNDIYAHRVNPSGLVLSVPIGSGSPWSMRVWPTPAFDQVRVAFDVPHASARIRLGIYDLGGRSIRTLLDGERAAGSHVLVWDGLDASGRRALAGVYFCRLEASGTVSTRKVLLAR